MLLPSLCDGILADVNNSVDASAGAGTSTIPDEVSAGVGASAGGFGDGTVLGSCEISTSAQFLENDK